LSHALSTLVARENQGFPALSKGLIVLLCVEVVRQGVSDHGALHSECLTVKGLICADISREYSVNAVNHGKLSISSHAISVRTVICEMHITAELVIYHIAVMRHSSYLGVF